MSQLYIFSPRPPADADHSAVTESAMGDADDVSDERRVRFWDFQNSVNASSARPPSYLDACRTLQLDVDRPIIPTNEATQDRMFVLWTLIKLGQLVLHLPQEIQKSKQSPSSTRLRERLGPSLWRLQKNSWA